MDRPARPRRPAHRGDQPGRGPQPHSTRALPAAARDRDRRPLALGDVVQVGDGDHAGQVAEVVGWGGRRGVELVIHGHPPVFFAVPPELLKLVDVPLVDPVVPRRDRPHRG
jgi:hypothetical protein